MSEDYEHIMSKETKHELHEVLNKLDRENQEKARKLQEHQAKLAEFFGNLAQFAANFTKIMNRPDFRVSSAPTQFQNDSYTLTVHRNEVAFTTLVINGSASSGDYFLSMLHAGQNIPLGYDKQKSEELISKQLVALIRAAGDKLNKF